MKRVMKKAACLVMAAALIGTSIGYSPATTQAAAKPKKIVMNKKKVTLEVGATFKLKVKKVTPKKASKAVSYKSAKKKIAKVSKKGKITAVAAGSTKITVTSKKNKKVKTTVNVTVTEAKQNTPQASTAPTSGVNATTAPSVAPTDAVTPTEAASPSPKRTQRPPATPTPKPTPKYDKPAQTAEPVKSLPLAEGSFYNESPDGAEVTYNEDGTMTIKFTKQWAAINFYLPDNAQMYYSNYKSVVITYKSSHTGNFTEENNGDLGHALFDSECDPNSSDLDSAGLGKHPDWGRKMVTSEDYSTKVFNVTSECVGGCIRGLQVFNPNEMAEGDYITITIKSVIFYDEEKPEDFVPGDEDQPTPSTSPKGVVVNAKDIDFSKADYKTNDDGSVTVTGDKSNNGKDIIVPVPETPFNKIVIHYRDYTPGANGFSAKFSTADTMPADQQQGWIWAYQDPKYLFEEGKTEKTFSFTADQLPIKWMVMFDVNSGAECKVTIESVEFINEAE